VQIVSKFDSSIEIGLNPYYTTKLGSAYLGDSLKLMAQLPDESIDLICTSPPFALVRKKEYGNVNAHEYIEWFKAFAREFYRILKPQGSLAIDIGGTWVKGFPVRSTYHFELAIDLCKPKAEGGLGFFLAQELFWYNPAKLPTPAEWVTVRRERVKDAVNTVWWLSKDPHPKANNKRVLRPYSEAMKNLLKNGYDARLRPSLVKLTAKAQRELLAKLLESIAELTEISQTELNRSFEDVVSDLDDPDKHIKGKALELLAIWMIRLTSLRFTKWRKRDYETGQGEVDVLAASDRFVYHRWQIQCKNTKRVDVEVLAKEVGMTFVTGADVVMIVTTGEFTIDAFQYAYRMMEVSRYYMVLIQKEDIEAIKEDRTNIIKILDRRARRVFAKKELEITDRAFEEVEIEEDSLTGFDRAFEEE
jgi:DNA modification methylase